MQICIGLKVLIIQLRFFWKLPKPLVGFLWMKRGVSYHVLGISRFKEKLLMSPVKLNTTYIHDIMKTFSDRHIQLRFVGVSLGRLLSAVGLANNDNVRCLQDQSLVTTDWSGCDLRNNQICHASLRAIVAFQLALHVR